MDADSSHFAHSQRTIHNKYKLPVLSFIMSNKQLRNIAFILFPIVIIGSVLLLNKKQGLQKMKDTEPHSIELYWKAPDINVLPATAENQLIHYGRELIVN